MDEVIQAMRQTAKDMSVHYKETSRACVDLVRDRTDDRSGLATSVGARASVAVPDC